MNAPAGPIEIGSLSYESVEKLQQLILWRADALTSLLLPYRSLRICSVVAPRHRSRRAHNLNCRSFSTDSLTPAESLASHRATADHCRREGVARKILAKPPRRD